MFDFFFYIEFIQARLIYIPSFHNLKLKIVGIIYYRYNFNRNLARALLRYVSIKSYQHIGYD